MDMSDDSDAEWARIADAVNVFEKQYIAAKNTPGPNSGQCAQTTAVHVPVEEEVVARNDTGGGVANAGIAYQRRIAELETEVNRVKEAEKELVRKLEKEVEWQRRETGRMRERMLYAEHEVEQLRGRVRGGGGGGKGDTAVGDVVEGTQWVGGGAIAGTAGNGATSAAAPVGVVKRKRRRKKEEKLSKWEGAGVDVYDQSHMRRRIAREVFGRAMGRGLLRLAEEEGLNELEEGLVAMMSGDMRDVGKVVRGLRKVVEGCYGEQGRTWGVEMIGVVGCYWREGRRAVRETYGEAGDDGEDGVDGVDEDEDVEMVVEMWRRGLVGDGVLRSRLTKCEDDVKWTVMGVGGQLGIDIERAVTHPPN